MIATGEASGGGGRAHGSDGAFACFDRMSRWYDFLTFVPELLVLRRLRRRLLARAQGDVLEVASGTGANLKHLRHVRSLVFVEPSSGMLAKATPRARKLGGQLLPVQGDAAFLPVADAAFDTVVSTLACCSFTDPVRALSEMRRACRPGGRVLLFEHGLSDRPWLERRQRRKVEKHFAAFGCHLDRDPLALALQSGLTIVSATRHGLGCLHLIEAKP